MRIYKLWMRDVNERHVLDKGWTQIYEHNHTASWNRFTKLTLEYPIRIGPGETCGFYLHSDAPNDLGLKYRSCVPGVVLEDENIQVTNGWAHTSCIPFDETRGWIRFNRVLSGNIFYEQTPTRWSPDRNHF